MEKNCQTYRCYVERLKKELVVAMGCTEPIAVAYCAARARDVLGKIPTKVVIKASGNIIKNVKSVIVPHTDGMRGLEAAAAVGIFFGDADGELEVISGVSADQEKSLKDKMTELDISVLPLESEHILDLEITVSDGDDFVTVHIEDEHTNVVEIIQNGKCTYVSSQRVKLEHENNAGMLKICDIFDFAESVDIADVLGLVYDGQGFDGGQGGELLDALW